MLKIAIARHYRAISAEVNSMGGSIPISPFVVTLGVPALIVPTVNAGNNQHSPNENLRLGNYFDGVRTYAALLATKIE